LDATPTHIGAAVLIEHRFVASFNMVRSGSRYADGKIGESARRIKGIRLA
jgi:hypothetical protein